MGAFNVLSATSPITGRVIRIQFKYGECWQHEYKLGDRIAFAPGTDLQQARVTLVGGVTEPPMTTKESEFYEIRFEYGFAASIRPISENEEARLENTWR